MPVPSYRVAFSVDGSYRDRVRTRRLSALVRRTLLSENVPAPHSVSVVITNGAIVRGLNRRFRGQDRTTDVLSFGLNDRDGFVVGEGASQLGEIVISFPTARRQAREAGHDVEEELEHLLVHGVLHLLGYDHERSRDEKVMRAREEELLGRAAH